MSGVKWGRCPSPKEGDGKQKPETATGNNNEALRSKAVVDP